MNIHKQIYRDIINHKGTNLKSIVFIFLFNKSFKLVLNYRLMHFFKKYVLFRNYFHYRIYRKYHCDISPNSMIGDAIYFPHPLGIVIGEGVKIGNNATIFHNVTFGSHGKSNLNKIYPVIKDNVTIYTGASILGSLTVNSNSIIGAHSLVLKDVKKNTTVVGSPAREV